MILLMSDLICSRRYYNFENFHFFLFTTNSYLFFSAKREESPHFVMFISFFLDIYLKTIFSFSYFFKLYLIHAFFRIFFYCYISCLEVFSYIYFNGLITYLKNKWPKILFTEIMFKFRCFLHNINIIWKYS